MAIVPPTIINQNFFTRDGALVIEVTVKGEWTEGKWFCRTVDEPTKVVIRTITTLCTTKAAARRKRVNHIVN